MIQLYPHQEKFVNDIRHAFKTSKTVLAQAPCGFGKTVIASYIAHRITEKGKRVYFLCHRRELLRQTANTFDKEGIGYGVIAPGYEERSSSVQIATMQTMIRRLPKHSGDLVFIDEAHLSRAEGWSTIINHFKERGAWICGLSASPCRLDGKGLGEHFSTLVEGPSMKWMIDNEFLSSFRYFAPTSPDLSGLHTQMGDYIQAELSQRLDKPSIVGDAISHWKKYASGKRTLVYCIGIKHSENTAAAFNAAGITARHVDGNTSDIERMEAIGGFANGEIQIITNCALWTEGLDISSCVGREVPIECVVLLRPTKSLALAIQMHGRGLRRKTQPAIFLDHANIVQTHGLPDDERVWSLEGQQGRTKQAASQISVKVCPKCFAAQSAGLPACKFCGFVFEAQPRSVVEVAGELEEIRRVEARKYQGRTQTLQELIALGRGRGYKYPERWAWFVMRGRQAKKLGR